MIHAYTDIPDALPIITETLLEMRTLLSIPDTITVYTTWRDNRQIEYISGTTGSNIDYTILYSIAIDRCEIRLHHTDGLISLLGSGCEMVSLLNLPLDMSRRMSTRGYYYPNHITMTLYDVRYIIDTINYTYTRQ